MDDACDRAAAAGGHARIILAAVDLEAVLEVTEGAVDLLMVAQGGSTGTNGLFKLWINRGMRHSPAIMCGELIKGKQGGFGLP